MMSNLFIKLTETDKRIIFVILAVFILLLVLVAYIGFLVTQIMKWQGKKINQHITDPVVTGVIKDEKAFKKYARKKNTWLFYHQARIPALITLVSVIFYIVVSSFSSFNNPFDHHTGFGTLFFVWDFSTIIQTPESGVGLLINWPELINTPHFTSDAWVSYIFVPTLLVGGIWYLLSVQAFIARQLQINKLGQKIFNEQLESFVAGSGYRNPQNDVLTSIDENQTQK